jgi:hypothetical protein
MRISLGEGIAAHVDEVLNPVRAEQGEELIKSMGRMADGPDGQGHGGTYYGGSR